MAIILLSEIFAISPPQAAADIIVRVAIADNDPDDRVLRLHATAGGVEAEQVLAVPNTGDFLDIREIVLSTVPAGTDEVKVTIESPQHGDSGI